MASFASTSRVTLGQRSISQLAVSRSASRITPATCSPRSATMSTWNAASLNRPSLQRQQQQQQQQQQQRVRFSPTSAFSTSLRRQQQSAAEPQKELSSGESEIHELLTKRFRPTHLQVQDVSGGCGSFYAIVIAAAEFKGIMTVKQHRLVNECLKDIIGNIHGLQLKTIPSD
ncbi:unnamed protein product [Jaminaea pallidilutea]